MSFDCFSGLKRNGDFNTLAVNLTILYTVILIHQLLLNFSGMYTFFINKTQEDNLDINIGYLNLIQKGNPQLF